MRSCVRLYIERRRFTLPDYLVWAGWLCSLGWFICSFLALRLQINHPLAEPDQATDSVDYLVVREISTLHVTKLIRTSDSIHLLLLLRRRALLSESRSHCFLRVADSTWIPQFAVGDLCKLCVHDLRVRRNAFDGHVDMPASLGQLVS